MPSKYCVLSIRDNLADTRIIEMVLGEDPQIELISLASGDAAISHLQRVHRRPNLILLASRYSGAHMTTLEILTEVKADEHLRVVPIVVLSALCSPEAIREFYAYQAACVIAMPADLEGIERALGLIKELWLSVACVPYIEDRPQAHSRH